VIAACGIDERTPAVVGATAAETPAMSTGGAAGASAATTSSDSAARASKQTEGSPNPELAAGTNLPMASPAGTAGAAGAAPVSGARQGSGTPAGSNAGQASSAASSSAASNPAPNDNAGSDPSGSLPAPPPAGNLATLLWSVGGEGIGPGLFEDARFVSVDASGIIYVAEFPADDNAPSRVQRFNPDGSFASQWFVADNAIVTGLVADRNGMLYINQGGTITRYDGASGMPLGLVTLPDYSDEPLAIALAPDNGLLTVARTQILRLDSSLRVSLDSDSIGPALDNSIFIHAAAMDGTGNIFVLVNTKSNIFEFDSAGTFHDRIGSAGSGPGKFDTYPESVAVDGRGRIYASDSDGVEVFDPDGSSRGIISTSPGLFGIAVTEKNELLAIDRSNHTLSKYAIAP
jgi:sugar lactone lactonase YvrE